MRELSNRSKWVWTLDITAWPLYMVARVYNTTSRWSVSPLLLSLQRSSSLHYCLLCKGRSNSLVIGKVHREHLADKTLCLFVCLCERHFASVFRKLRQHLKSRFVFIWFGEGFFTLWTIGDKFVLWRVSIHVWSTLLDGRVMWRDLGRKKFCFSLFAITLNSFSVHWDFLVSSWEFWLESVCSCGRWRGGGRKREREKASEHHLVQANR